jgi:hypothetical protein
MFHHVIVMAILTGSQGPGVHCNPQLSCSAPKALEYFLDRPSFLIFWSAGVGGSHAVFHNDGWCRLYRGTSLAQFGVRSDVLPFMGYEKMVG